MAGEGKQSWRDRHHYLSDVYEDDEGAPDEWAYTADEKRSRDRWRMRLLGIILVCWIWGVVACLRACGVGK